MRAVALKNRASRRRLGAHGAHVRTERGSLSAPWHRREKKIHIAEGAGPAKRTRTAAAAPARNIGPIDNGRELPSSDRPEVHAPARRARRAVVCCLEGT